MPRCMRKAITQRRTNCRARCFRETGLRNDLNSGSASCMISTGGSFFSGWRMVRFLTTILPKSAERRKPPPCEPTHVEKSATSKVSSRAYRGTDIDRPAFTEYSTAWPRPPGSRVERPCKPCFPKPNLEESASMNQHLHGHVTYTPINLRGDPTVNTAARHARVGCRIKPGHPIRAPIHPGGAPRPICASSPRRPASGGRPPRGSAGTGSTRPRRRTHRPEDAR